MTPDQAAAIADGAPGNRNVQTAALKRALSGMKPDDLRYLAQGLARRAPDRPAAEQGDLFGFDESAMGDAEAEGRAIRRMVDAWKNIRAALSAGRKRPDKLQFTKQLSDELGLSSSPTQEEIDRAWQMVNETVERFSSPTISIEDVNICRRAAGMSEIDTGRPSGPDSGIEIDSARGEAFGLTGDRETIEREDASQRSRDELRRKMDESDRRMKGDGQDAADVRQGNFFDGLGSEGAQSGQQTLWDVGPGPLRRSVDPAQRRAATTRDEAVAAANVVRAWIPGLKITFSDGPAGMLPQEARAMSVVNIDGKNVAIVAGYTGGTDPKSVRDYIKGNKGIVATIIETGLPVEIGGDLPHEYANSKYSQRIQHSDTAKWKDKARFVPVLDDMVEIATNRRWEKEHHKHKRPSHFKYGFYRYDSTVAVPDGNGGFRAYDVELVINNHANGKHYLYDVVNISENAGLSGKTAAEIQSRLDGKALHSPHSLANQPSDVNAGFVAGELRIPALLPFREAS